MAQAFEQVEPRAVWQEANILGEGREDTPGQKLRDLFGLVFELQVPRQIGEFAGNLARDACSLAGGIERARVKPDRAQPFANLGAFKLLRRIRKFLGPGNGR